MATKVLEITEEKVRAAAHACPDAANVLKTLFPEVFREQLEAGDLVQYRDGHVNGPFVVVSDGAARAFKAYWPGSGDIQMVSLQNGDAYSHSADGLRKLPKPIF